MCPQWRSWYGLPVFRCRITLWSLLRMGSNRTRRICPVRTDRTPKNVCRLHQILIPSLFANGRVVQSKKGILQEGMKHGKLYWPHWTWNHRSLSYVRVWKVRKNQNDWTPEEHLLLSHIRNLCPNSKRWYRRRRRRAVCHHRREVIHTEINTKSAKSDPKRRSADVSTTHCPIGEWCTHWPISISENLRMDI